MRIGSYKTDREDKPHDFILLDDDGEFVDIDVPQDLLRQIWEVQVKIDAIPKEPVCPECHDEKVISKPDYFGEILEEGCPTCQGEVSELDKVNIARLLCKMDNFQWDGLQARPAGLFGGLFSKATYLKRAGRVIDLVEGSTRHGS